MALDLHVGAAIMDSIFPDDELNITSDDVQFHLEVDRFLR